MRNDRDAAVGQARHQWRDDGAAFELDRVAPGFLHVPPGVAQAFLDRHLIAHERHVAHDERIRRAAAGGAAVMQRLLDRQRQGVRVPKHGHRQRIADEQHFHARIGGERRGRRIAHGDHDDLLSGFLHLPESGDIQLDRKSVV